MAVFEQIPLPFETNGLEPVIDQLTVETHYGKHHATYTATLNKLLADAGIADQYDTIEDLLSHLDQLPEDIRTAVRNNGGGFYNHNLYFSNLAPQGSDVHAPEGKLAEQINTQFGGLDALVTELKALALGQFGSGWSFLSASKDGTLITSKSPNQDNPLSEKTGNVPILCLDVWEHAYYLKYKNLRADYLDQLASLIDWKKVSKLYEDTIA